MHWLLFEGQQWPSTAWLCTACIAATLCSANLCGAIFHMCLQTLNINPAKKDIDSFVLEDFELVGYNPHKKIDMKMAV